MPVNTISEYFSISSHTPKRNKNMFSVLDISACSVRDESVIGVWGGGGGGKFTITYLMRLLLLNFRTG